MGQPGQSEQQGVWPEPAAGGAEARGLDLLGIGFLVGDGERTIHLNDAAVRLFGRPRHELLEIGQVRTLLHPTDEHRIAVTVEDCRHRGLAAPDRFTARIVQPDGSHVPVELWVKAEVRGDELRTYTFVHELTDQWAVRDGLAQLALTDPLTGLPNRLAMEEQLRLTLARMDREPGRGLLLFCDLDDLKGINDRGGHAAGDQALVVFASRLSGVLRAGDTAARMGGDEFVALLAPVEGAPVDTLVARIQEATTFTLPFEDHRFEVAASIGWVGFGPGARSPRDLLQAADAAMYEAKVRRRGDR